MQVERRNRIRHPHHRWSVEVWEASAADGAEVIVKNCLWGQPSAPMLYLRRAILKREAAMLALTGKRVANLVPQVLFVSEDELILERFSGPSFFEGRQMLSGNSAVFEELARTIEALHNAHLAHGEIRLGNIMWNNGQVRLIDFPTAVSEDNPLYQCLSWLDRMSLLWIKANIFRLPLETDELRLQDKHSVFHSWFLKYVASDIPLA